MKNVQSLIQERNFNKIIQLAETDVFTTELIDTTIKNELGLINYHSQMLKNDQDILYDVISGSVDIVIALMSNSNISQNTLMAVKNSNYAPLSDYAIVKIGILKYNNR